MTRVNKCVIRPPPFPLPAVDFVFKLARYSFTENAGRVEVTLVRVGETTIPVTATLTVVEGSGERDTHSMYHLGTDTEGLMVYACTRGRACVHSSVSLCWTCGIDCNSLHVAMFH